MVFMEPVHVGVLPLVQTWAAGEIADYLPEHVARLVEMISGHLPLVLAFLRGNCREIIPSQDMNLVQSFLNSAWLRCCALVTAHARAHFHSPPPPLFIAQCS